MSTLSLALRKDRIARFVDVARGEGLVTALRRARQHLGLIRAGQIGGVVAPAPAPAATRYALGPAWRDLARKEAFHLTHPPAYLRRRRLVAMLGDLNLPQCRKYRVEQLDELWRTRDVEYRFSHYEDVPRACDLLNECTHLMLYRLGRSDLASMYLYEARRLRLPVVYDIDDPLFSVSAYATYSNMGALDPGLQTHFLTQAPLYLDVMNMADLLSFSTPGLVTHAQQYTARPALLRRNFADRQTLEAGKAAMESRPVREGFTVAVASGSAGHDADLAVIRPALLAFLEADRTRRLLVLGQLDMGAVPNALCAQIETVGFRDYPRYLASLARADCAVMPLTDDAFNRCKSAVRVLDAAAVGVASLVSSVGDLSSVVEDGVTGRVIGDDAGWGAALDDMARDPRAARAMGAAARTALEKHWGAQAGFPVMDPRLAEWVIA
ncbi:MAG: glycosyltransferase [Rhodobacteraceae bacterium]|nr:glycosyltransferase [Paracoccaceae bacterium]